MCSVGPNVGLLSLYKFFKLCVPQYNALASYLASLLGPLQEDRWSSVYLPAGYKAFRGALDSYVVYILELSTSHKKYNNYTGLYTGILVLQDFGKVTTYTCRGMSRKKCRVYTGSPTHAGNSALVLRICDKVNVGNYNDEVNDSMGTRLDFLHKGCSHCSPTCGILLFIR